MKMMKYGMAALLTILAVTNVQGSLVRPWGDASSLSTLQSVFTGIGSSIDAVNDQSTGAIFEPSGTGHSVASYVASVSWVAGDIEFGLYNTANPNQTVSLFNYNNGPAAGDSVVIQFDQANNWVRAIDLQAVTVYDSSSYFREFGFYATSDSGTYYSEDHLNDQDNARFLTYEGKGEVVTIKPEGYTDQDHWYIAAETGASGDTSMEDFSDMVVQMESIVAIPEPGTISMIALGSFALFGLRKKRRS